MIKDISMDKPEKWPANAIEYQLDIINKQISIFIKDPSYKNKEVLISLVSNYDLNQCAIEGLFRTTDYEVLLINTIFLKSSMMLSSAVKIFIYEIIGYKTRMQKIMSWTSDTNESLNIKEFENLLPQLQLYYLTYQKFTVEKTKSYAEQLIESINSLVEHTKEKHIEKNNDLNFFQITQTYLSLINDISYFKCKKRNGIWAFTREEIYNLFNLASELIDLSKLSPLKRPLKGVLKTCISNYILKSRNDYNQDYICKYIGEDVAKNSIDNQQIWMRVIENLNDEREQQVVPELFEKNEWLLYGWANNIDFTATRKYYVSSFCKTLNDENMKDNYGKCIYGYKDDRMVDLLSPIIIKTSKNGDEIPVFSQVVAFDVIYNQDEAKNEILFLCKIIDCLKIKDEDKKILLEELLQYWVLSVKDPKWEIERERRYVIFMYDEYKYIEVDDNDSRFLKLKTSLFLQPDFILGDNPIKYVLRKMVDNKREAIAMKQYLFCENCFNRDFDSATNIEIPKKCPICSSKDISIIYP